MAYKLTQVSANMTFPSLCPLSDSLFYEKYFWPTGVGVMGRVSACEHTAYVYICNFCGTINSHTRPEPPLFVTVFCQELRSHLLRSIECWLILHSYSLIVISTQLYFYLIQQTLEINELIIIKLSYVFFNSAIIILINNLRLFKMTINSMCLWSLFSL